VAAEAKPFEDIFVLEGLPLEKSSALLSTSIEIRTVVSDWNDGVGANTSVYVPRPDKVKEYQDLRFV